MSSTTRVTRSREKRLRGWPASPPRQTRFLNRRRTTAGRSRHRTRPFQHSRLDRAASSGPSCSDIARTRCVHAVRSFRSGRRSSQVASKAPAVECSGTPGRSTTARRSVASISARIPSSMPCPALRASPQLPSTRPAVIKRLSSRRKNSSSRLRPRSRKSSGGSGVISLPS
jgi:hypothetical protein